MEEENANKVIHGLSFILILSKDVYNTPPYMNSHLHVLAGIDNPLHLPVWTGKGPHVNTSSFHAFFVRYVIRYMRSGSRNIS